MSETTLYYTTVAVSLCDPASKKRGPIVISFEKNTKPQSVPDLSDEVSVETNIPVTSIIN